MSEARDGFPLFITQDLKKLDRLVIPSTPPDDPKLRKLYVEKIRRIILANYIMPGFVKQDIRCFGVSKGDDDIRLVYDGTKSEVNSLVWVPNFFLPSSISLARMLMPNTYQMDEDIGEMFLNFPMLVSF